MSRENDFLREEYTIDTPENVTFVYDVAGIGSRFIGALIDSAILAAILLALLIFFSILQAIFDFSALSFVSAGWVEGFVIALFTLLFFTLIWGYFILFEWLWNGRTPGKRIAKTRVVRSDGNPAGLPAIVVRNLVRAIDFLPFAYGVGLITMFLNRQSRRLGDFAAGSMVVRDGGEITLESLASAPRVHAAPVPGFERLPATTSSLTAADYDLIRDTLHRYDLGNVTHDFLWRLSRMIAAKLALERPPGQNSYDLRNWLKHLLDRRGD